ncbi:MAG: stage II sporulation protein P [Ruminococcaceae bacterium]|nr:stage II sporulation protein P [Oscillospiraceae bacterium]
MKINQILAAIAASAMLPATMMLSGATAGELLTATADITMKAAYISAGVPYESSTIEAALSLHTAEATAEAPIIEQDEPVFPTTQPVITQTSESVEPAIEEDNEPETTEAIPEDTLPRARVISQNITPADDGLDYTAAGTQSGAIFRRHYSGSESAEYITLASGAQVRNCTYDSNDALLAAAQELPDLEIELYSSEPQVLIIHTHTTESYEPYIRAYYDADFPSRSCDPAHNMIAVGEVLAQTLADNGISVLHDGTLHDYPAYTGSYDRSEETIRAILSQYPSIKVVIDLHRDAMAEGDGSRIAPTAIINGRNAAQFMIISGCDDGTFNMPHYMENFKLAALLQNMSEAMHPSLARPVLFDYRNYNQHITTGSLLIEIGSHANALEEALYTAELLGESMAAALAVLS